MRMIKSLVLGAVSLLALASWAQAADLVGDLKQRYDTLQYFSAEFEQKLTHKESGAVETRYGTLHFKKPLLIRWETKKPIKETLVVTGKEIWDYIPEEEVAYRYPHDLVQDSRSIIQVLTGQAALSKDFDIKEEGSENGMRKIRLYPKDPTPQMVEALIWVDAQTFIRRVDLVDFYGNHNDVNFTKFIPDVMLGSGTFQFTPPKGVDVEDRTDKAKVQERELFK